MVFDRVITNNGGFYHNTTGVFTAPQDGVYVFYLSAMTLPNDDIYLHIVKDGIRIDDVYSDARDDNSYESLSETWVLNLSSGSEVWIWSPVANLKVHEYCHTQFSGFLLHNL